MNQIGIEKRTANAAHHLLLVVRAARADHRIDSHEAEAITEAVEQVHLHAVVNEAAAEVRHASGRSTEPVYLRAKVNRYLRLAELLPERPEKDAA